MAGYMYYFSACRDRPITWGERARFGNLAARYRSAHGLHVGNQHREREEDLIARANFRGGGLRVALGTNLSKLLTEKSAKRLQLGNRCVEQFLG